MENTSKFQKVQKINWYRCQVDPQLMRELMQCSDAQGFRQAGGHLALWFTTGIVAYLAFRNITVANWHWSAPLLLLALFAHGTVGSFLGGAACHELSHKTPFKTKAVNELFLKIFAFFAWWDQVWFRPSHIRHHQTTVYHAYDGEVVLPQKLSFGDYKFWLGLFAWNPWNTWNLLRVYYRRATGHLDNEWYKFVLPDDNPYLRVKHRNWARFTLIGHAVLALTFIATGNWFLIVIFDFGAHYCAWLAFLCGFPQHYGMSPDVPDHRLSCRTYISSGLPAFLYWNMQYHIEHHMFPAVPFFNLGKLHRAIEQDLPASPDGLLATWKGILGIHWKQRSNPDYCYVPTLPGSDGVSADDGVLEREAGAGG